MKEKLINLMDKNIKINGFNIFVISMIYIYLSIIIFLIGWIKPIFSIPITILLWIFIFGYIKYKKKKMDNIETIYINFKVFLITVLVVCLIGWALGWTGQSKQTGDWEKHNGVLTDLIKKDWPVYYENNGENSMLSYYIGQYIVPSIIGKIINSVSVAQFFHGIWAIIGLLISVFAIFKITKSDTTNKQLKSLIYIFGFSVCLSLSQVLGNLFIEERNFSQGKWFIKESPFILQYTSNIVLLRWVMPQCIIPWIVVSILYDDPYDIKHFVVLCLPVMFYSSFAFIGLIVYLCVIVIKYILETKKFRTILVNIFSLSNIFIAVTLGAVLILYFIGNILSEKPGNINFRFVKYGFSNVPLYIFFIISFLPYTFILYKKYKQNIFYWVSTVILLLLPFFRMGLWNDFCMRTSIIPLYIYMIMSLNLLNNIETNNKIKKAIVVLFIIGCFNSFLEFSDVLNSMSFKFTVKQNYTLELNANRDLDIRPDDKYNYFVYDIEDNLFYKYLARKKIY